MIVGFALLFRKSPLWQKRVYLYGWQDLIECKIYLNGAKIMPTLKYRDQFDMPQIKSDNMSISI